MSLYRDHWHQQSRCLPWWWFVPYLSAIIVFVFVVVFLVSRGYDLPVAVGVPVTLSAVVVSALSRVTWFARPDSRPA